MIQAALPWAAALAAATLALAFAYCWLWKRTGNVQTPSGFGVFLAPVMLGFAWLGGAAPEFLVALAVTLAATVTYWFDDIVELGAWLRVGIAAATGFAIAVIFLVPAGYSLWAVALLAVAAAVVNVALANMVNFQDGADLNLALFIVLAGALLLVFAPALQGWTALALGMLGFTLAFALVNSRPRTLYFGDSGSFAFGALFTILGANFLAGSHMPPPEAAIPAALPFVDTVYVTVTRVRIRQRFTVRHYFHLYQRLQRDYRGFVYLLPQLVNAALCLGLTLLLQAARLGRVASVLVAMILVSVPFFIACHRFFVRGEPGPPEPRR